MRLKALLIAALLISAFGCGGQQQDPTVPNPYPPNPNQPTDPNLTNPDPNTNPSGQPTQPSVDPVSGSVCTDTVAIQGTAEPGASVFVVGGLSTSGIATDAHPVTGRFCIDVPLKKGQSNTLEVRAQDPTRGISEATMITVSQGNCNGNDDVNNQPNGPTTTPGTNVALGAPVRSKDQPDSGTLMSITDGDASTSATFSGGDWYNPFSSYNGWATVRLDKLVEVKKIVVKWGDPNHMGADYKVLTSSMSDPGDPSLDNGNWVEAKSFSGNTNTTNEIDTSQTKPLVQHVAVWMQQDNASWTYNETFVLSEIEVYNADSTSSSPLPSGGNTCSAMGN